MHVDQPASPLKRFFAGLAEYIFQSQLGVADPPLIDYVGDLLVRFVRLDALYRVRSLEGRPLIEVAEMVTEAEQRAGDDRRELHRHVGDFALFWVGLYPEALRKLRGPLSKDVLVDYSAQGKHAYFLASTMATVVEHDPPGELLERLSREFEMCAFGLRQVRQQWELDAAESGDGCPLVIN